MRADRGSSVVAASYRLQSLQAAAEEVLPALGAATNATLAFIHHTDPDDRQTVVTWPPSRGELLARYTQDYVAECPFVPVKMAARESVVPITRRLSRRQVTHNAFYADLLRPAALHHHVELRLEPSEQGLPRTAIILGRDEAAGETIVEAPFPGSAGGPAPRPKRVVGVIDDFRRQGELSMAVPLLFLRQ